MAHPYRLERFDSASLWVRLPPDRENLYGHHYNTAGNATIYLPLSELDITHPTLDRLNAGRPSFVESTLAAPGK